MVLPDSGASLVLGDYKEGADGSRRLYGAVIQALKANTKSNLLSTPSIVTMDNEEAYIVVGQNVPFVTGSVSTGTGGTVNPCMPQLNVWMCDLKGNSAYW